MHSITLAKRARKSATVGLQRLPAFFGLVCGYPCGCQSVAACRAFALGRAREAV